jgi:aspartyl-tRNA(Asn)/glutamyl-tRNA(Gln) amidotransferase subunit C
MTKEEIKHLGTLSRIKLAEEEVSQLSGEIDSILNYVGQVNEIVADTSVTKTVGPVHNVLREDTVTNGPGTYSDDLIKAFPEKDGRFLKVKKILNPDN